MPEFDEMMEKLRALTVWRHEQSQQNPLLTNAEVVQQENQLRAQLPANVTLIYDERAGSYGIFPGPFVGIPRNETTVTSWEAE